MRKIATRFAGWLLVVASMWVAYVYAPPAVIFIVLLSTVLAGLHTWFKREADIDSD
jgi:hypothetical protein